ncbi:5-methyltetrahydropteroyltriglutamate--homocysteine S-methyltransferase [Nakamurella leprariae]|uniref:5-methyltetrahydropteroyltriglutamate--homocysteine methyltransferase n=1 Tax=Nakamurella leprariae TaxID=2803911 RepID=A0A938YB63_9ACTN|nr:5-methyltetrahydropteroyltriglutamate--homocysteine S-methyltransferase [Nakamurella leprariae]MBM9466579.1 5-methyltetrahydropteroyltriglutamate--homocysteine S-methyltransferase [Nakamurella leprariae]
MIEHPPLGSTVLGYPRIGPDRELKRAVERYWAGESSAATLRSTAADLRRATRAELSGLGSVPGNTFSYYDQVLDAALAVGAVPPRFASLADGDPLDLLFAMARGAEGVPALEMTKWFDTNYHFLVPEIGPDTEFSLRQRTAVEDFTEGLADGVVTRPVLVGPVTLLLLSKGTVPDFRPLDRLADLLPVYAQLLAELKAAGAVWVQLDEPAFAADRTSEELDALSRAYAELGGLTDRPALLVAGYFGPVGPALPVLAEAPIEGIALDLVAGAADLDTAATLAGLRDKTVVAGVVEGRNVWRVAPDRALAAAATLLGAAGRVEIGSSCSLLHVPYDAARETALPAALRDRLAFAREKVAEVVLLGRALAGEQVDDELAAARAVADRSVERHEEVRERLAVLGTEFYGRPDGPVRARAQADELRLPSVPTTTIGSFPQTGPIRRDRAAYRAGRIDAAEYQQRMRAEIERVVRLQEDLGLDVLVHGEPERNDMVQYFAEHLDGFATTEHGWVQSYGSRCVRPPILYGDVARPEPITVGWSTYAKSLTDRPMKAMLTGPVTILAWSFVRADQPLGDTAFQVALALRDEVTDLETAGLRIIQVDEPALRELLPLRAADQPAYLDWAVNSFKMATGAVADTTQIHTHLCYSEFGEVVGAIDGLDADVTTVEAARSKMEVLDELGPGVTRALGPGIYDVHSPEVPDVATMVELLRAARSVIGPERLWANPDCGLKTRGDAETTAALRNLVAAAAAVRAD